MSYSLKLKNEIKKIYGNLINLLEDRGYTDEVLGRNISTDTIDFKIHNFLESDNDSTFIDLFIPGEINTYVKFFKDESVDKSLKSGTKQRFNKSLDLVKKVANLSYNDNIIFVLINSYADKEGRKSLNEYESLHPYLRIFTHKELLINIARHSLVPKHRLFIGDKNKLFKKLMINFDNQLPYILHGDPIARYYNFRHTDIIEVLRPTKTDGFHKVYRVCIDLDLKTKSNSVIKKTYSEVKEDKMGNIDTSTITLTFSECVENHAKNQKIGEIVDKGDGFSIADIIKIKETVENNGYTAEIFNLKENLNVESEILKAIEPASVIVIRNGVNMLFQNEGIDNISDKLFNEQAILEHDKKAKMYGQVRNKRARHNLCFADFSQEPDYKEGKGTIYAFGDPQIPLTTNLRNNMSNILNNEKVDNLLAEGNYYYDKTSCGIGYHGDLERRKVIGVRLGASGPLIYNWFHRSKPVENSEPIRINLNHGDIYVMSEKAVGTDFRSPSKYTLRHAAGCEKFTTL